MDLLSPEETVVQTGVSAAVEWLRLLVEATGALIICVGVIAALSLMIREWGSLSFNAVRLRLARYLVLALEFQLAADILSTSIAPTWDKIGKLAAIAVIRTLLNYFLMKEMHEEETALRNAPAKVTS